MTRNRRNIEHVQDREFVALVRMNWGDGMLMPGDRVPDEPGRNMASLIRQGKIQSVIIPTEGGAR